MKSTPNASQLGDEHTSSEEELQALFAAEAQRLLKTLNLPPSPATYHEEIVEALKTSHPDIHEKWLASADTYAEAARFLFPFLNDEDQDMSEAQADEYEKLYQDALAYGQALAKALQARR